MDDAKTNPEFFFQFRNKHTSIPFGNCIFRRQPIIGAVAAGFTVEDVREALRFPCGAGCARGDGLGNHANNSTVAQLKMKRFADSLCSS